MGLRRSEEVMRKRFVQVFIVLLLVPALSIAENVPSATEQKVAKMKQILNETSNRSGSEQDVNASKLMESLTSYEKRDGEQLSPGSKMFQGLALCLGFFLVGIYFYRRFFPSSVKKSRGAGGSLHIIDRIALTQSTSLVMVEVAGKHTLLSVGSERVQVLQQHMENSGSSLQRSSKKSEEGCLEEIKLSA